jgi:hypothetical protein
MSGLNEPSELCPIPVLSIGSTSLTFAADRKLKADR